MLSEVSGKTIRRVLCVLLSLLMLKRNECLWSTEIAWGMKGVWPWGVEAVVRDHAHRLTSHINMSFKVSDF
jgi:hypothetical protein